MVKWKLTPWIEWVPTPPAPSSTSWNVDNAYNQYLVQVVYFVSLNSFVAEKKTVKIKNQTENMMKYVANMINQIKCV